MPENKLDGVGVACLLARLTGRHSLGLGWRTQRDGEILGMAYTETYHCDVCGNPRGDAEDWWLAVTEPAALIPKGPEQPMLKVTPWNVMLSHAANVRHLCGARCAQTLMDRWMRGE